MKTEEEIKDEIRVTKEALKSASKIEAFYSAICQREQLETLKWVLED